MNECRYNEMQLHLQYYFGVYFNIVSYDYKSPLLTIFSDCWHHNVKELSIRPYSALPKSVIVIGNKLCKLKFKF